ncbi:YfhL family 4Fe-4S dicluster ferredoxin [Luteimonas sp. R10]|uniref:YfhL family 4Fe-4S dicluster ferredoxin n=1 Tax=Luteimonas sp. R10 TaxID=3108176 RepID=UPI003089E5E2|nr:YfhL family 4Fe-4S dicluster ferredoxin [Luteimonas sp. R10]
MSLKINDLCVNCDVCEPACPNQAIAQGETIYVIDPARCTECVGHFDEPQCVAVCPVECIDPDPEFPESEPQLLAKLRRLQEGDAPRPADIPSASAATPDARPDADDPEAG